MRATRWATALSIALLLLVMLPGCRKELPLLPRVSEGSPAEGGPLIVACAGDSITADSYPQRLEKKFKEASASVRVINAGIPGFTSREYLRYLKSENLLVKTNPHLFLLQLGTNDVRSGRNHVPTDEFVQNMKAIIELAISHENPDGSHPQVLLSTVPPIVVASRTFTEDSPRRVREEINPAIKRLAEEFTIPLVDTYQLFLDHPELLPEIHPSQQGYQAMADNWFELLLEQEELVAFGIGERGR